MSSSRTTLFPYTTLFRSDGEQTGKVVELTTENYVEPEIEKKVDEDAVNRGEIVEYTLTIDLPGDIGSYNEFVIYDELDSRLSYVDRSEEHTSELQSRRQPV